MSAAQVVPTLTQGSYDASRYMRETPDLHIHCAAETPPDFVGVRNKWLRIDDVPTPWNADPAWRRDVMAAAQDAANVLSQGGTVLTTCFMGLNRSGLISALALLHLGVSADDAVELVRAARGNHALGNRTFVEFIRVVARAA